jgi:predicted DNA binding CopG/RHH family protein
MSGTEVQRLQDQNTAERQRQQDQLIDARIQAGSAAALAKANAAEVNARVALDKVQNIKIELAKRGITIKDD